jgi:hypothetical protein
MKKIFPLLAMIPMMATPAMAGLDTQFQQENAGQSLTAQCYDTQLMLVTQRSVPTYAYYQTEVFPLKNIGGGLEGSNVTKFNFVIVKGNKVYGNSYVRFYENGRRPGQGDCKNIKEIATLGREEYEYVGGYRPLYDTICGSYEHRSLWKFEDGKLINYTQCGSKQVKRHVWN